MNDFPQNSNALLRFVGSIEQRISPIVGDLCREQFNRDLARAYGGPLEDTTLEDFEAALERIYQTEGSKCQQ